MLTIRKEQMKAFERSRMGDFEHRLIGHLGRLLEDAKVPAGEGELASQVHVGIERGLRYFRKENDLARYCEIVLLKLGGWTDQDHPQPAVQMLQSKAVAPDVRLRNFERWATLRRA